MKTIAVLFGGVSSEHDVSCISAQTVIKNINHNQYKVILIGITTNGEWLFVNSIDDIQSGTWYKSTTKAIISPDRVSKSIVIFNDNTIHQEQIDIVFPVLHGLNGEDGTIQGLLELAQIPYVGCGVLASSVSMDKFYTKIIVDKIGIEQAKFVGVYHEDLNNMSSVIHNIETTLDYPVFVKPSCAGSSKGVSKAHNRLELEAALIEADKHDNKILVEETITGRELECAILGDHVNIRASGIGEILAAAEFYDFDAKYNNSNSKTILSPDLPSGTEEEIRQIACKIFKAVSGYGLSRVDFFLEKDTNRIVFNEINTLPGFTSISMYPMLWNEQSISCDKLVEELIQLAETRF